MKICPSRISTAIIQADTKGKKSYCLMAIAAGPDFDATQLYIDSAASLVETTKMLRERDVFVILKSGDSGDLKGRMGGHIVALKTGDRGHPVTRTLYEVLAANDELTSTLLMIEDTRFQNESELRASWIAEFGPVFYNGTADQKGKSRDKSSKKIKVLGKPIES